MDLVCLMTSSNDQIVMITWKQSNGNILFNCDPSTPCENKTTIHTLEQNDTFISSTLAIRNVSLVHEDEYDVIMKSLSDMETCKINLTVNGNFLQYSNMISTFTNTDVVFTSHQLFSFFKIRLRAINTK